MLVGCVGLIRGAGRKARLLLGVDKNHRPGLATRLPCLEIPTSLLGT